MHTSYQAQSNSQLQHQAPGLGSGVGETVSFDRRKDRASSSNATKQKLSHHGDALSRSLVRPSSKNRLSSQQPSGSNNQVNSNNANARGGFSQTGKQTTSQVAAQQRGSSPKIPPPQGSNSAMSGQNLQNYFIENNNANNNNNGGTLNNGGSNSSQQLAVGNIPQFGTGQHHHGSATTLSNKNLPRKKRITVQQQQNALIGSNQTSTDVQGNNNATAASTSSILGSRTAANRSKTNNTASGLPPMNNQNNGAGNNSTSGGSSQQLPRAPSPGTKFGASAKNNNSGSNESGSQATTSSGGSHHQVKKPGSRSHSHNNERGGRPTAANHDPQPFQKEELFLNVDSQYNDLIMQMIQPNRSHFNFESAVQYVMNASELSNQALAKLLYTRKNIPMPKLPEGAGPAAIQLPTSSAFKPPGAGNQRSRNIGGVDSSNFGRNGAAGQSTASFFNTKKSFSAATLQQANSGLVENGIKRSEGYHDGPDSHSMIGKDFYQSIRGEVRTGTVDHIKQLMPDYQSAKYSAKRNGIVAAYGANTNQGIVRNYNEDRVAIILNIMKPKSKQFNGAEWPKCSFFGIYDGHGGHVCADFLRDYLHQFIIKDQYFPKEPIKAIKNGFKEAEKLFLEFAEGQQFEVGDIDRSGSCAIVALIIDDMCYIGNTGDSRACMSADGGKQVIGLSNDHKPTDDIEMHRILSNSGRIYQNASIVNVQQPGVGLQSQIVLGPHRVFPGRLSVCRTFGDIEAKLEKLDGNVRVVVADPDVTAFRIDRNKHDFIVIGCDGIFDKLENRDCNHLVWQACLMEEMGSEPLVNAVDEETQGNAKQAKTQDERRHKLAGLAVDSILKACAMRRSCDNITSVVIAFDNFYRKLDETKSGGSKSKDGMIQTGNDHEVFEEIQMLPVGESNENQQNSNNVIYIESDDHLESITESQNMDQAEDSPTKVTNSESHHLLKGKTSTTIIQSSQDGLYGETGTTNPSGTTGSSQNTTTQSQMAAMTMLQNSAPNNQVNQVGPDGNPYHLFGTQDKILSEIAEEDSISMISDKPRRFKPSDCVTPADPVTNSFMGSMRESKTNGTNSRLKETANRMVHESNIAAQALAQPNGTSVTGTAAATASAQVFPYGGGPTSATISVTVAGKSPVVGSGSSQVIHKRPPSATKNQQSNNDQAQQLASQEQQPTQMQQRVQLMNRPISGQRSGSGQNSRLSQQSTKTSSKNNTNQQANGLHHIIDQNQGSSNNQAANSRARQGGRTAIGNTTKILAQHPAQQQQQQQQSIISTSAYGDNSSMINSSASLVAGAAGGGSQADAIYGGGSTAVVAGASTVAANNAHLQQHHSQSQQSLMPSLGTSQSEVVQNINTVANNTGQHSNSAGTLYQVKKQTRRSSNQSHQRGTYGNSGNQQQRSSHQNQNNQSSQQVGSQSQGSMPPPTSSNQLLPLNSNSGSQNQSSGSISLVNQKRQNHQQSSKNNDHHQPTELFRQVDGGNNSTAASGGSTSQNQVVNTGSSQFVQKGSLSSNNQMLMRTMQMNNPLATHGAQVHNIQIKPISANKRRGQGPQNLMQAQFHNTTASGQPQSSAGGTIGNILNRGPKDKAQFSQTSVLNTSKDSGSNQAKQPANKLISQYLAQVNQNSSHHHSGGGTNTSTTANNTNSYNGGGGGAYASRSTRNAGATTSDKPSPGVFSRAQRVQMTYNQSLPQSKTQSHNQHHQMGTSSSNGSGSRQQSSHSNNHPPATNVANNNTSGLLTNSAYAQSLLHNHPSGNAGKKEPKSRNGSNSHTANSNLPVGGGSAQNSNLHHIQNQAASGGHSQHHLPKWQSLNNNSNV